MLDTFNILSKIQLKYELHPLNEYDDIVWNSLFKREKEVIDNIEANNSYFDISSYNILHNTFYLNRIQQRSDYKRFFPHIYKRLQLVSD